MAGRSSAVRAVVVRVGHPVLSREPRGEGLLRYRQCKEQLLLFPSAHPAWENALRQEDERLLLRVTYLLCILSALRYSFAAAYSQRHGHSHLDTKEDITKVRFFPYNL